MDIPSSFVRSRGCLTALARWGGIVCLLWALAVPRPAAAQSKLAELLVETNVPNATILLDGSEVGQTNEAGEALIGALRPGRRTVEVQKAGYWSASTRVTLEAGLTTTASLTLLARPSESGGSLLVETNVAGATVLVDSARVGPTRQDGQAFVTGLAPGPHRVRVEKAGYAPVTRTVTFDEPGLDRTVTLRLRPAGVTAEAPAGSAAAGERRPRAVITAGEDAVPPESTEADDAAPAELIVDAGVQGAQVVVDDSVRGRTGATGRLTLQALPGTRYITVRRDGFQTVQTTRQLEAGGQHTVSLSLKRLQTANERDPLGGSSLDLAFLFVVSLGGLAGLVAVFLGIYAWQEGALTRWIWGSERFDQYDLLKVLRRNEFSTVYLANEPAERRRVALKVLDDPYAGDPDHADPFLEKGRTLKAIRDRHPDAPVIEVHWVGRENDAVDGRPFIALEHLEGRTLLSHLKERGRLDVPDAIATIRQVCVGLRAAHDNDVHHGSLTPESIVVTQTDPTFQIRLIGFGLETYENTDAVPTTTTAGSAAAYTAPEQIQNGQGDWRADMYSVGILFYKLVTGTPPHADDDPTGVLKRHAENPRPDLPEYVPEYVKPVFYRMISGDPDRRPTASRVVSVLDLIEVAT